MPGLIDPRQIRTDLGTQMRTEVTAEVVKDYADAMDRGVEFPPILVCYNEPENMFIMIDGYHRLAAHMLTYPNDRILAEQMLGDVSDAIWASLGMNQSHGLRRTNEDKRNAVKHALLHPKGADLSDRQIAEHVGVSHSSVSRIRAELEGAGELEPVQEYIGRDGKRYRPSSRKSRAGIAAPIPETATCGSCAYLAGSVCTKQHNPKPVWLRSCDRWKPNDNSTESPTDRVATSRRSGIYQYERYGSYVQVELSPTNPSLFAVELRNHFANEYLTSCISALRQLLMDNES